MAPALQSHPAPLLAGLPTSRACHPAGQRTPPTHTSHHAVVSLNPAENPGQARVSVPAREADRPKHAKRAARARFGPLVVRLAFASGA
jgi:hypothetical protein